jgi:Spy/CpxP family protein refolding chaperone
MKKATPILIAALLLFVCISSSNAQFQGIFKNKRIAEELKLTDDQIETLKEIVKSTEKKMIQLRADIETKEVDLRDILDEDVPDEGKAVSLVKDIMKLKTDQRVLKIKEMIAIKKTLTPDQIEKFHEIQHEHMMRKGHDRKGEKRGNPGPERKGSPERD